MNKDFNFDNFEQVARIKVIGIGGGGNNAVNRMVEENVQGVEFYVANTDKQILLNSRCKNKIILGKNATKGLGAGADPSVGREAALESESEIREALDGADMVFIAAGMGGGTGTGAAPIFAKIAKEIGALTIAIVTRPFSFEGKNRNVFAAEGLQELKHNVDSLIVISNDRLLQIKGDIPFKEAFKEADDILRQSVQTITDLITMPATINLDFADVKNIMKDRGTAMIGLGRGKGDNKAQNAATMAITSPLLESSIIGAKRAIVSITGGNGMSLYDTNDAIEIIRNAANSDINIIFGVSTNDMLDDEMFVTIIATDFSDISNPIPIINKIDSESRISIDESTLIEIDKSIANYNYNENRFNLNNNSNKEKVNNSNTQPVEDQNKIEEAIVPSFLRKRK